MQEFLNKTPFLRYFVPLALGIVISLCFDVNGPLHWQILAIYALLALCWLILAKTKEKRMNYVFAVLLNCLFFAIGLESCYLRRASNQEDHYSKTVSKEEKVYIGFINDIPQEKEKTIKCKITLLGEYKNKETKEISGELLVYVQKTDNSKPLYFGDKIIFRGKPTPVKEPLNPAEFNYKKYLEYKNIFHQVYLKSADFIIEGKYTSNYVYDFSVNLRVRLLEILKSNGLEGDEFAITAALLLGYDDTISSDLMSAYSHTGTLHVLSVSGLHVGMLFLVLNFLIRLPKGKWFTIAKTLLILGVLWFYALLSGLSPSVVRSTIMFSFVLVGILIGRKGQIFNTLFASATMMLLYDPFLLIDAGFQLSYLAVGGIVFFYPCVFKWYTPRNKISETVWKMFAVSLSAQIITLPITLYYFHQFPVLFFVANMVVIPLSYAVMFGAVLILFFSKVKIIAAALVWIVAHSVWIMNSFTEWLDQLSFSNISGINTGKIEMLLLFGLIVSLTHAFLNKHYLSFVLSFSVIIFLLSSSLFNSYETDQQEQTIVYSLNNQSGIQLISGRGSLVLSDSLNERSKQTIENYSSTIALKDTRRHLLNTGMYTFTHRNRKWCILIGDTLAAYDLNGVSCDYFLVAKNAQVKGIESVDAGRIIVDGSNGYKTINYLKKKFAEEDAEKLWITRDKGAYIVE